MSLGALSEAVMAKKFFYVCAGLLSIALSFAVGFSMAQAQSGSVTYFAGVGGASAAVSGRAVYYMSNGVRTPTLFPAPVPGSADVVSVLVYNGGYSVPATTVILADGDVYHWSGVEQSWALMGSYGGTTGAASVTMGSLKAKYR
jgi:hypothetical protein